MKQKVKFFQICGVGSFDMHTLYGLDGQGRVWFNTTEEPGWMLLGNPEEEVENPPSPPPDTF